jgi:hypothetical protein
MTPYSYDRPAALRTPTSVRFADDSPTARNAARCGERADFIASTQVAGDCRCPPHTRSPRVQSPRDPATSRNASPDLNDVPLVHTASMGSSVRDCRRQCRRRTLSGPSQLRCTQQDLPIRRLRIIFDIVPLARFTHGAYRCKHPGPALHRSSGSYPGHVRHK